MKRQGQLSQAQGLSDCARLVLQTFPNVRQFHELLQVQEPSQVNSVVPSGDPAGVGCDAAVWRREGVEQYLQSPGSGRGGHCTSVVTDTGGQRQSCGWRSLFRVEEAPGVRSSSSILP